MSFAIQSGIEGGNDYGGYAVRAERQRQAAIDRGMSAINAVYGGGTYDVYNPYKGAYDPSQTYYEQRHSGQYLPIKNPQAFATLEKKGKAFTKGQSQSYQGFTPDFYNQRQQAYIDYAMPQLARQYRQNQQQIGFGLANRGLMNSAAAGRQYSDLNQQNLLAKQGIADSGLAQAQALQNQVEASKTALMSQLYSSADPASATQGAVGTAASFRQPSTFAPLANMFSSVANQYALAQLMNNYRPMSYVQTPEDYYGGAATLGPSSYSV